MKFIEEIDVNNKTIILRCDLNVTIKNGQIMSDERIVASLETINYLKHHQAKTIIMSHLGRVETEEDKKDGTLAPIYNRLNELLPGTIFCPHTSGAELEQKIKELNPGEVLLIENTRFEDIDGKKESSCDENLSKYWASLADIFINDAFGLTHRRHASNYGITKYIPSGYGFLIQKELMGLKPLITPEHPFVVLMSGAKVADKIELIESILKKCDYLLLGGGIANTFLALNHNMGKSLVSEDSLESVKKLMDNYYSKIILPVDGINQNEEVTSTNTLRDEDAIYDIGPDTVNLYANYINEAKLIFINGTVGMYEDPRFEKGTKAILEICSKSSGKAIVGGGDALASAEKFGINEFDFISTGGGATLDYISSGKLKCEE